MKRLIVVLAAALVLAPSGGAGLLAGPTPVHAVNAAPSGLHAFLLRPDEATQRYYPRTPSFAWNPVSGHSGSYDFELATSRTFNDSSVLFSYTKLTIPAIAIAHQLPWMTGVPYALWAHVRWVSKDGKVVTPWSDPYGFNMRWTDNDYPQQLPAPEGLIRWKPIEGATRYEVLYPDISPPFENDVGCTSWSDSATGPTTTTLLRKKPGANCPRITLENEIVRTVPGGPA